MPRSAPGFCVPVSADHFPHRPEEGRRVSKGGLRSGSGAGWGGAEVRQRELEGSPQAHPACTRAAGSDQGPWWRWCFSTPWCAMERRGPPFQLQHYTGGVTGEPTPWQRSAFYVPTEAEYLFLFIVLLFLNRKQEP